MHFHTSSHKEPFPPQFPNPPVYSLMLKDTGDKSDDLSVPDFHEPAFKVLYNSNPFSSKPDITLLDAVSDHTLGTVRLHSTSSRIDVTISKPNLSSSFTYRESFLSSVSGAGEFRWKSAGKGRYFNLQLTNAKDERIATYAGNKDLSDKERRPDVWRNGLPSALIDEIVVTLIGKIKYIRDHLDPMVDGLSKGLPNSSEIASSLATLASH